MTTGGTVNYTDGYPRSVPGPAHANEGIFTSTISIGSSSSINKINSTTTEAPILLPASSVTGSANSFYFIRGYTADASAGAAAVFMGHLFEVPDGGHTAPGGQLKPDDAYGTVGIFAATKNMPCNVAFPQPRKLPNGAGLNVECYNKGQTGANFGNTIVVYYSLITNT